jgi:hypothetical protein
MACQAGLELGGSLEVFDLAHPAGQWVPSRENLGHQPPLMIAGGGCPPERRRRDGGPISASERATVGKPLSVPAQPEPEGGRLTPIPLQKPSPFVLLSRAASASLFPQAPRFSRVPDASSRCRACTRARMAPKRIVYILRSLTDPRRALLGAMQRELRAVDVTPPVITARTMAQDLERSQAAPKVVATRLGVLGGLALVLASIGLYAVVAFAVARRSCEIGISDRARRPESAGGLEHQPRGGGADRRGRPASVSSSRS